MQRAALRFTRRTLLSKNINCRKLPGIYPATMCPLSAHSRYGRNSWKTRGSESKSAYFLFAGILTVPMFFHFKSLKKMLGIEDESMNLEEDELQEKVKKAVVYRRQGNYDQAIVALTEAINIANARQAETALTSIYSELANVYVMLDRLEDAQKLYMQVVQRMVRLHHTRDTDPEFILLSLKIADLFAMRGNFVNAEQGFLFCVEKQQAVTERHHLHMSSQVNQLYVSPRSTDQASVKGPEYEDPIALLGMCYQSYAYFLVEKGDYQQSETMFAKAMEIAADLFGAAGEQVIIMLNNYGTRLINKLRFDLAEKYLWEAVKRGEITPSVKDRLPGFYCNYAEALFHNGKKEQASDFANRADKLTSNSDDVNFKNYVRKFKNDIEKELKYTKKGWWLW